MSAPAAAATSGVPAGCPATVAAPSAGPSLPLRLAYAGPRLALAVGTALALSYPIDETHHREIRAAIQARNVLGGSP